MPVNFSYSRELDSPEDDNYFSLELPLLAFSFLDPVCPLHSMGVVCTAVLSAPWSAGECCSQRGVRGQIEGCDWSFHHRLPYFHQPRNSECSTFQAYLSVIHRGEAQPLRDPLGGCSPQPGHPFRSGGGFNSLIVLGPN